MNGRTMEKHFIPGINIIYVIDSLKTVYGGYRFRTNTYNTDKVSMNDYSVNDSIMNSFQRNTDNRTGNTVNSMNIGYTGKSKNQRGELKSFISFFKHQGYNDYELEQFRDESMDYKENFNSRATNAELSIQADYTNTLSDMLNMEAGIKSTNRVSSSANEFEVYQFSSGKFVEDNTRANDFNYDRDIYAAYSNLNITLKTWQIRIGGRYEQTLLKADYKDTSLQVPDYKNLVPSILINKSIGTHNLKLGYNKQILRPYLSYLNPAINYSDSLNLEFGNPYLSPEITHRYELGYTGTFNTIFAGASLFYSRNRNSIENIRTPGNDGVFYSTYQNIGRKEAIGMSGNISWKKQKFTVSTNFTLRYMMLNSAALQLSNNGFQFNGNINLSWKFKNGYSAEGIIYINSKDIRLQGSREGWKYYSLVINKKILDDKLTISLGSQTFNRYITEDFITPAFNQRTITRYQIQYIMLGVSWKFGKKEVRVPVTQQASTD
ncbi:MAG: outer membrane beta-barrel family protein [Bacteroidota bacterium]